MDNLTLAELKQRFAGTVTELHMRALDYSSYADFVDIVNDCVDHIFIDISRDAKFFVDRSEDEISIVIKQRLRDFNLDAVHDELIGGHCDVVVKGRYQYLWIGEAKISRGNKYLHGGLLQLITRYLNGDHKSCCSAVLIYCKNSNVTKIMGNWREKLAESELDFSFYDCSKNPCAFITKHVHQDTGLDMTVRHIPLPIYFNPQDQKK